MPRWATAMVVVAVAVIAAGLEGLPLLQWPETGAPYKPWRDLQILRSMLPLSPGQRDYIGPTFSRDRDFAVFLHGVLKLAPETDRFFLHVAQPVAETADWYRYRAAYLLAPTPVELWQEQAGSVPGERQLLLAWQSELPPGWEVLSSGNGGTIAQRSSAVAASRP